jgi:hypothetical protein
VMLPPLLSYARERVCHELIVAGRPLSTGELVRVIYCHARWDRNFAAREPPRPQHWMYERVRAAAAAFADRAGTGRGMGAARGYLLQHYPRAQKGERYRTRRASQ